MTRVTNTRIAGFTFLAYIAVGITSMVLFARATGAVADHQGRRAGAEATGLTGASTLKTVGLWGSD